MKYNFKHKVQSTGKKLVDCKIYYFYFIGSIVIFWGIISCESHKKVVLKLFAETLIAFGKQRNMKMTIILFIIILTKMGNGLFTSILIEIKYKNIIYAINYGARSGRYIKIVY